MWDRTEREAAGLLTCKRAALVGIFLALGTLAAGCGKGDVARLPVHGTVSLPNGEKLSGSITFVPAEGMSGPGATTGLTDGRYQFDRSDGPTAGPHRVTVMRAVSKRELFESGGKKPPPASKPAAAPKVRWTLSADVADDGTFQCDFTLEP